MEILENSQELALSLPPSIVVIGVNGSKKSYYAVKWALENFLVEKRILFKLLHVRAQIMTVPTPLGNYPISQVREDIVAAYKQEVEWKTQKMLLPYRKMFTEKKVEVETLIIEADSVAEAILREVSRLRNCKLVIGASHARVIWKLKSQYLSARISECTPSSCTVYLINKGKLSSVCQSNSESDRSIQNESRDSSIFTSSFSSYSFTSQTGGTGQASTASRSYSRCQSLAVQHFQDISTINEAHHKSRSFSFDIVHSRSELLISNTLDAKSVGTRISGIGSFRVDLYSLDSEPEFIADAQNPSKIDISFELEELKIELRHARGVYAVAQNEPISACQQRSQPDSCSFLLDQQNNVTKRRTEESLEIQEISLTEELDRESERQRKETHKPLKREAGLLRRLVEREASERRQTEHRAALDASGNQKLEKVFKSSFQSYKKFTWKEIVSATSSFSDDLRIGMGAYGTVYRCTLNRVTAAVKVLQANCQRTKEFQQEVDMLSRIHHPHLLLLLGVCPDHSCLVYEYMENGSLEDRMFQKNGTPPIPWFKRYRIAWEIASALILLHNSKPKPIVHRNLKPSNILLDRNLVSKIGDVGLSTSLHHVDCSQSPIHMDSGLVGTLSYIDPEYQRSGLVSPKSDVYAFGMIILQLLTAKPALALTYTIESVLDKGQIMDILDSKAGNWPIEETKELVFLGLRCVELIPSDRPDLSADVLPLLERLMETADKASYLYPIVQPAPPKNFT